MSQFRREVVMLQCGVQDHTDTEGKTGGTDCTEPGGELLSFFSTTIGPVVIRRIVSCCLSITGPLAPRGHPA